MQTTPVRVLVVSIVFVMASVVGWAQKGDLTHEHPATPDATVGFGVFPPATGFSGTGCSTTAGVIGGPNDPCAFKGHLLDPDEVTILKGGEVTFHVHGGGHAIAIYEVSKDTTRDDIGQYLCDGFDRSLDPSAHPCLNFALNPPNPAPGVANANANHNVADGKGNVVIVSGVGGPAHPANRVWSPEGRLMSAGGQQFLTGVPPGVPPTATVTETTGQLITYGFLKTGRYLVICINRSHFLNDWMFGFVNVVGG
jgi:hypothetical protein